MPDLLLSPQRHAPWIPACAGMTHDEPLPVMPAKAGIQAGDAALCLAATAPRKPLVMLQT
jgi:hypothetical protein